MEEQQIEVKQLSKEQLDVLKELQEKIQQTLSTHSSLYYERMAIQMELDEVDAALKELETQRRNIVIGLQNTFGTTGTIDLNTGIFHPDKQ